MLSQLCVSKCLAALVSPRPVLGSHWGRSVPLELEFWWEARWT